MMLIRTATVSCVFIVSLVVPPRAVRAQAGDEFALPLPSVPIEPGIAAIDRGLSFPGRSRGALEFAGGKRSRRARVKLVNDPRHAGGVIAIDIEDLGALRSHGLDDLLTIDLLIAVAKAEEAARAARESQEQARARAGEAEETAATARRLDPGFAAHYPDRDAIWAYVNYTLADGGTYAGKWRAFRDHLGYRAHGLGVLTNPRGTSYRGDLVEGQPGGSGILENKQRLYEGALRHGRPSGQGVEQTSIGRVFAGDFDNGSADGHGIIELDGESYIGEIGNGRKQGLGRLVRKDGSVRQGLWHDNRLIYTLAFRPEQRLAPLAPGAPRVVTGRR